MQNIIKTLFGTKAVLSFTEINFPEMGGFYVEWLCGGPRCDITGGADWRRIPKRRGKRPSLAQMELDTCHRSDSEDSANREF
jgi:hypothetical protein